MKLKTIVVSDITLKFTGDSMPPSRLIYRQYLIQTIHGSKTLGQYHSESWKVCKFGVF